MGHYNTSIICKNGHLISGDSNGNNSDNKYCRKCGAETITSCPYCNTPIRGRYEMDGIADFTSYEYVPSYCHNCGKPYPWTETALKSANALINEDENLNSSEKQQLAETLPDLIVETPTPKTQLSIARFKKLFRKAASYTADGVKEIIVDIASETIKKSLGF